MNYAGHENLRAEVAEVANAMCDLRARLNDMEHRCRFDSDVLVERLARQTLYRANRLFMEAYICGKILTVSGYSVATSWNGSRCSITAGSL
ncbi:hypothetical protein AB0Y82_20140 [Escherichia coli]